MDTTSGLTEPDLDRIDTLLRVRFAEQRLAIIELVRTLLLRRLG